MLARHFNTPDRQSFRTVTRLYAGRDARRDLPKILPPGPLLLVADVRFTGCDAVSGIDIAVAVPVNGEPSSDTIDAISARLTGRKFVSVLAIGGGSAIDTAKALHARLSFGDGPVRDQERPAGAPVLVAMPTNAGSGSETSRFFILSDDQGVKRAHRAWSFAPDIAVLDPTYLTSAGPERIALAAFDSFLHLWETYICRNERAPFVEMLALEGIALIAAALEHLSFHSIPDEARLMGLQRASAYGGMAISNVRTGLIHTLGESIAAQVPLGHPEALLVFFAQAINHYADSVRAEIARLDRRLAADVGEGWSFAHLCETWCRLFDKLGVTTRIDKLLADHHPDVGRLHETAARDVVLPKEHPAPLDSATMTRIIAASLDRGPPRSAGLALPSAIGSSV